MQTNRLLSLAVLGLSVSIAAYPADARKRAAVIAELPVDIPTRMMPAADLRLKPNQYRWYAPAVRPGPVEVVMSLSQQMVYVFRSGELLGVATMSSGKEGRSSPYGRFQILEKRRVYHSIRYDNAPMPWMMRLNWYGVAMHGGHNPGYPASHGCFRLPHAFAKKLFSIAEVGSFVYVTHDVLETPEEALDAARANYAASMPEDRLPRNGVLEEYAEAGNGERPGSSYAQQTAEDRDGSDTGAQPASPRRSLWHRLGGIF